MPEYSIANFNPVIVNTQININNSDLNLKRPTYITVNI